MTPGERWRRVQDLCEQLEGLPAAQREGALTGAEADEGVRAEVRELMAALAGEERARQEMALTGVVPALPTRIGEYAVTGLPRQGSAGRRRCRHRSGSSGRRLF